jgi:hypothetical protein
MFLLSPEADMRPGDLQARFRGNAFWFADGEARQRLPRGFLANKGRSAQRLGALVAHGLLRNRKETEVSHSPTVSRHASSLVRPTLSQRRCVNKFFNDLTGPTTTQPGNLGVLYDFHERSPRRQPADCGRIRVEKSRANTRRTC